MDLITISRVLSDSGIHVCPICGTPFEPYHSRQKTCGSAECKKEHHNQYVKDRVKRLKEEDPEAWRKYHAKANKRYRHKQKALDERDKDLKELEDRWKRDDTLSKKIAECGHEYGKRSAEKLLATIPKIDVNLGGNNGSKDNKDKRERG